MGRQCRPNGNKEMCEENHRGGNQLLCKKDGDYGTEDLKNRRKDEKVLKEFVAISLQCPGQLMVMTMPTKFEGRMNARSYEIIQIS